MPNEAVLSTLKGKTKFSKSKNIEKDTNIKSLGQKMRKLCLGKRHFSIDNSSKHIFHIFWARHLIFVSFPMFLDILKLFLSLEGCTHLHFAFNQGKYTLGIELILHKMWFFQHFPRLNHKWWSVVYSIVWKNKLNMS